MRTPAPGILALLLTAPLLAQQARIYEMDLVVPTYGVAAPDPNPRFFDGRTYQGAQGRVYPYPMRDVLTNEKTDRSYHFIVLENDYIQVGVLPEIGGRIFWAVDKTNGYDFFYRQHVVKPALIGMLGAWISGGVEWNFPHHHRANSFMPMDWRIEEHEDGSKTLWLTEIERRQRMKMLVGLTIYPDRSVLEATLKFFNRTPLVQSFLYFANPAVHVDSTYQVIFPPEVEFVTQHAKREFSEWPLSRSFYGGMDYSGRGIDWWMNLPSPVSFFAWDHTSDYFGGYDHGRDAGTVYVGDHQVAPGKKFFAFGNGDQGRMWDQMLTDTDGPYLELMAGAFSDNQPDYSWIQPYEVKTVTQSWFPVRDLQGLRYASTEGALNVEIRETSLVVRVNTSRNRPGARLLVRLGDRTLTDTPLDLAPDGPGRVETTLTGPVDPDDLQVTLRSSAGDLLLDYRARPKPGAGRPEPVLPPPAPETITTNEELFLAGLRLDQFHHATRQASDYYDEALRRDSLDSRVNSQVGITRLRQGRYAEAERHLRRAVNRLSANYTRVRDGEPLYYLGLVLEAQGRHDEAYDALSRAVWSHAWRAAGHFALARIDARRAAFERAIEHLDASLRAGSDNTAAWNLRAALLRRLGHPEEAGRSLAHAHEIDPLDLWTQNELTLLAASARTELERRFAADPQLWIEVAADYAGAGLWEEARDLLQTVSGQPGAGPAATLAAYWLGWIALQEGDRDAAGARFTEASRLPDDYVFPFRLETIPVLEAAIASNPADARARLYLGNLLYDLQPVRARERWKEATEKGEPLVRAHRNLGYALGREGRLEEAVSELEKAVALDPSDARLLFELDVLREAAGLELADRLAFLEQRRSIVMKRDDATLRLVTLRIAAGAYDEAIAVLDTRPFNVWEGGGSVYHRFVDAHLLRGIRALDTGHTESAIADFRQALTYPRNLEVGRPRSDPRWAQIHALLATALEAEGRPEAARVAFEQAVEVDTDRSDYRFWTGLGFRALGQNDRATELFAALEHEGQERLSTSAEADFFAKFEDRSAPAAFRAAALYTLALGRLGLGKRQEAEAALAEAGALDPSNPWLRTLNPW